MYERLTIHFVVATLIVSVGKGNETCPEKPLYDPTIVYPHETVCTLRRPDVSFTCHSCCDNTNLCCDDGSCIAYDRFCRYPSSCCAEQYCGQRCCNTTRGDAPCGPVCSPHGFQCCNSQTGLLCRANGTCCGRDGSHCCADPDICCGDHCCPETHFCCNGHCCETGETCCGTICCRPGTHCCGDNHCCPDDTECENKALNVFSLHRPETKNSCCPDPLVCGSYQCCPHGDFCVLADDACCDYAWCGEVCCHRGSHCNDYRGCCRDDQKFCPHRNRNNCFSPPYTHCNSDGSACPANGYIYVGDDYCCPSNYPYYKNGQNRCYNANCQECGSDQCCYGGWYCSGGRCKRCHHHWYNHHCHYDQSAGWAYPKRYPDSVRGLPIKKIVSKQIYNPYLKSPVNILYDVPPPPPMNTSSPNDHACFSTVGSGSADPCVVLPCLETISGCGRDGYIQTMYNFLCIGFTTYSDRFNSKGKEFIYALKMCMSNRFKEAYSFGVTPCCETVANWSENNIEIQCFIDSGFCSIYLTNLAAFNALFSKYGDPGFNPFVFYVQHCKHVEK